MARRREGNSGGRDDREAVMRKIAIAAVSLAAALLVPTGAAEAKRVSRTSCNNTKLVNTYSANYHAVASYMANGRRVATSASGGSATDASPPAGTLPGHCAR